MYLTSFCSKHTKSLLEEGKDTHNGGGSLEVCAPVTDGGALRM